ncbi:hypothetical protein H4S08_001513 [Coemansia sp. RSA 1365]|nr:hypothetical protein H4S08_001513 [Coemansia sp. RSA 1365]
MSFISYLKKLVITQDEENAAAPQSPDQQQRPESIHEPEKLSENSNSEKTLPPPPPSTIAYPPKNSTKSGLSNTQSTTSMASLRTQVESERQTASSSSMYQDFTRGGHADAGHWNDPPTVVFKPQNLQPKKKQPEPSPNSAASDTSSFMIVDSTITPNGTAIAEEAESTRNQSAASTTSAKPLTSLVDLPEGRDEQAEVLVNTLHRIVDCIPLDTASPMIKRMVEDTNKRLALLGERLPTLDNTLVSSACIIALLIEKGMLLEAADAHRGLMQAGYEAELKWLVGLKRVIELRQKST